MPLTKKGNLSTKHPNGGTWRRHLRIESIVRLDVGGFNDTEIAISQGVTPQYVNMLKRTPQYIAKRTEIATGVIAKEDLFLRENIENGHAELRHMVPTALLALRDSLHDKMNPKLRFEAAKEILDREGSLAKVSKSQVLVRNEYDYSEDDLVEGDLLAALNGIQAPPPINGDAANIFSSASLGADAQKELQKNINLADFNTKTVQ